MVSLVTMVEMQVLSKRIKILMLVTLLSVALVFLTAFTKYIYAKDYIFLVESTCDPELHTCFVRDCEDYCPPNALESYRVFSIQAKDFHLCTDNSCSNICTDSSTSAMCEELTCEPENDDCSS